jgi:hypothetical protein
MSAQTMAAGIGERREVAGVGEAYAFAQEPMSVMGILRKGSGVLFKIIARDAVVFARFRRPDRRSHT